MGDFLVGFLRAFVWPAYVVWWFLRLVATLVVVLLGLAIAAVIFLAIFLPSVGWTAGVIGGAIAFVFITAYYYTFDYVDTHYDWFRWMVI